MKLAHRVLLVLSGMALIFAVMFTALYAIEDWRGARAWALCRHILQARGESLEAAAFIPPMIPDDENLAMAPFFVRLYGYRVDPVTRLLTFPVPPTQSSLKDVITTMPFGPAKGKNIHSGTSGDFTTGKPCDFEGLQKYYRNQPFFPHTAQPQAPAEDVLLALTKYDPIIDELSQAMATRPKTRFPINWTSPQPAMMALPHYQAFQCVTTTLRLRALAHLDLGRNDEAMRDMTVARRLIEIPAADPMIIAQLVSATETGLMMQPIWEGLRTRRWAGAELETIKTGLQRVDYLAACKQAFRGERAHFVCGTLDYLKLHGDPIHTLKRIQSMTGDPTTDEKPGIVDRLVNLCPSGWYDRVKVYDCLFLQREVFDAFDVPLHRVWPTKVQVGEQALQRVNITPQNMLLSVSVPVYFSILKKSASYQAVVDHTVIACALEQFYLDHQVYPGRLDELTPAYLDRVPPDLIDGAPTRYRLTPDGRYLLYSIGWNGRDDGGQVAWQKAFPKPDNDQGDWVWQYTELQPPATIQRSK